MITLMIPPVKTYCLFFEAQSTVGLSGGILIFQINILEKLWIMRPIEVCWKLNEEKVKVYS